MKTNAEHRAERLEKERIADVGRVENQPISVKAEPQEDTEAMRELLNIVSRWRDLARYRSYDGNQYKTLREEEARQVALEAALEQGRRFLEERQWL
jgi:hypothetical protein